MKKKSRQQIDKPFRSNLEALWREFRRCSEMYRPLYHDQLLFSSPDHQGGPLSHDSFLLFANANMPDNGSSEWWIWEQTPMGPAIGRFSGCPDGLLEFKKLAESAAILFDEMELDIPAKGYDGWLNLLHNIAWWHQLPLLRCKTHPPLSKDVVLGELETLAERWHSTPDDDDDYPGHLWTFFLVHSVFTSSMTLIEAVLDPESVVITSSATSPIFDIFPTSPEVGPDEEAAVISSEHPVNVPPDRNVFRQITEKSWFVQFVEGGIEPERGFVEGSEGFYLIQKVLSSEKQPVSPVDLYAAIPEKGIELAEADDKLQRGRKDAENEGLPRRQRKGGTGVGDMADAEAIANYRNRRRELLAIIEKAQPNVDSKEIKDAKNELDEINKELNRITDINGNPRSFPLGTPAAVARHRVKTSWCRALKILSESKKFDKLSEFLYLYLKTQGAQGRQYMKAGEVKWET